MEAVLQNAKDLGPVFLIVWAVVFIFALWKPQRYFNSILLMGACLFSLLFISSLFGNNMDIALLVCAGLVILAIFCVPVMLIINGVHMLKRESKSLGNMLSLILGIVIAVGEIAAVVFVLGMADFISLASVNIILLFVFITVLYFSLLILSFVAYSVFIQILPHGRNFDFVIIHGCRLAEGENMTRLLQNRVDKALEIYEKCGKKPVIIPSGGQGADEKISEAQAMKNYLLSRGVPEDKIVLEDKSTTTEENLLNSRAIIEQYAGKRKTALVSSNYHIYRCLRMAREIKMNCVGIGAKVAFYYWPSALIREFAAVFLTKRFFIWSMIGYLLFIGPVIWMIFN